MATKVAIEVDVKTGEASDDIIALREELEKVKQTQEKLSDQMKTGFDAAKKGAKGASKGMKCYVLQSDASGNASWQANTIMVMGELFSQTPKTITGSGSTMTLVDNTTTLDGLSLGSWDSPSNGRLRYTGTSTLTFHMGATVSVATTAGNNQQITVAVYKNGVVINGSQVAMTTDVSEYNSTAIHKFVSLATNDYIELYVENTSAANDVIVNDSNLFTMSIE